MDVQVIIVAVIVLVALVYLGRTLYKNSQGHSCESGKCSHHPSATKK
jgi:hypothetical protein